MSTHMEGMMHKTTHYYVRFNAPGTFFGESFYGVESDTPIAPEDVVFPDNAYAFTICTRTDVTDEEGTVYRGKVQDTGKEYWHPASRITTVSYVEAMRDPKNSILLDNMRCNKWDAVIWTRWNNWPQPYRPAEMEVLPHKGV